MQIRIDTREPVTAVAAFTAIPDIVIERAELRVGDYELSSTACVERKEAGDFVASILDGRFIPQGRLLSEAYPMSFWIVEGDPFTTRSAITPAAIAGALSYVCAILGSTVIRTSSVQETALVVSTIARHIQEGLGYVPNMRPGKPTSTSAFAEFLVSGLPGIGGGKARALLDHFGSPERVFTATVDELAAVKGIGSKRAAEIRTVLTTNAVCN